MMQELKRILKLVRYGYGVKGNLISGVLLSLVGIVIYCVTDDNFMVIGALYLMLGPVMLIQVTYSLLYCGLAGASPRRRGIELLLADWVNIISGIAGYLVLMLVTAVRVKAAPEQAQALMQGIILGSLAVAAVYVCFGACYKYYWQSMALFFVVFLMTYTGGLIFMSSISITWSMAWTAGISGGLIALGVFLACVLRRLVYKKAMSPIACGTSLRKAMQ